ncbi:hypothetical protein K402DRAFT_452576 [Aulographum hederae CBS 113979]|uniref:Cora-domain-containing protein n=1 Tax=Aulographum hederae CBS 113979 TaxID=1176131 RepID=A0A6G1H789_9PEZI|nr:hypothetical protein K402DRAFT_452576 [Aulographum hederae CBS 113979]
MPMESLSRSPTARDPQNLDRRGSILSRLSSLDKRNGLRHRTNTVITYSAPERPNWQPGAEPGIDTAQTDEKVAPHLEELHDNCQIKIVDFSDSEVSSIEADNESLAAILEQPRPKESACRWISVNGLSWDVIKYIGNRYKLHRLAIEDLINTRSRTKVDWYSDHAFVLLTLQKLVRLHQHDGLESCGCGPGTGEHHADDASSTRSRGKWKSFWKKAPEALNPNTNGILPTYEPKESGEFVKAHTNTSEDSPVKPIRTLHRYESAQIPEHTAFMEKHSVLAQEDLVVSVEQVSIFLMADNTVISFFEHSAPDIELPILERLDSEETMLRRSNDASLLMQAIIDAVVDLGLPVKDAYNNARKELQIDTLTNPSVETSRSLHIFGEEIDMLQNLFKPIVHLVNALRDHNSEPLIGGGGMPFQELQPYEPGTPGQETQRTSDRPDYMRMKSSMAPRKTPRRPMNVTSVTITPLAHTYLGDVLDHCITTIQALVSQCPAHLLSKQITNTPPQEQMDASAQNLTQLIFNTIGARTNFTMKTLTYVTLFFAPLTVISGYFGMNFANGNGLDHPFAFFWKISLPVTAATMIIVLAIVEMDRFKTRFMMGGLRLKRRQRVMAGRKG